MKDGDRADEGGRAVRVCTLTWTERQKGGGARGGKSDSAPIFCVIQFGPHRQWTN